jgi:hypothetical protein
MSSTKFPIRFALAERIRVTPETELPDTIGLEYFEISQDMYERILAQVHQLIEKHGSCLFTFNVLVDLKYFLKQQPVITEKLVSLATEYVGRRLLILPDYPYIHVYLIQAQEISGIVM